MKQNCPKCGNYVEGELKASFARKMTRAAVKKGSAMATGAAIGSIVPGVGTIIGGALGLAAGVLMEDEVKKASDVVEDIAFDNSKAEYDFHCPKCGHKWISRASMQKITCFDNTSCHSKTLKNKVFTIIADKLNLDYEEISENSTWEELGADSLDAVELILVFEKEFDLVINDEIVESIRCVGDIFPILEAFTACSNHTSSLKDADEDYAEYDAEEDAEDDAEDDEDDEDNEEDVVYDNNGWEHSKDNFHMVIEGVFQITGRGTVIVGRIDSGVVHQDDTIYIENSDSSIAAVVTGVEMFRKILDRGEFGDNVGLLLKGVSKEEIQSGDIALSAKLRSKPIRQHVEPELEDDDYEEDNSEYQESEAEYMETLKEILEDGEISERERRLLAKLRVKLGISEERATELEASLFKNSLTEEEQEYLDEYREMISEGGEISPRERKLLDKIAKVNDISPERIQELESLAVGI